MTNVVNLLKNNFLEKQVLSLVKSVKDIDEIWQRLEKEYGDLIILILKKLAEMGNLDALWKMEAPSKVVEILSKIINIQLKPNCTMGIQSKRFTSSWVMEELNDGYQKVMMKKRRSYGQILQSS